MPGLNATIGITLLLPVTFSLNPGPAMLMLIGVYCGATFAGSISAILIKTPGTAAASATVLEGYPMTLQGKAPVALSIALRGSVIGGVFSGLCLLFLAPQVAKLALKFGAPPDILAEKGRRGTGEKSSVLVLQKCLSGKRQVHVCR